MKLDVRHPLPFWRKLRLENKILILFACLMVLVGAIVLFTQDRLTRATARQIVLDHVSAVLADSMDPMAAAVEKRDEPGLSSLLEQAAMRDDRIAYLSVSDEEVRSLAAEVREEYSHRHRDFEELLERHFAERIAPNLPAMDR